MDFTGKAVDSHFRNRKKRFERRPPLMEEFTGVLKKFKEQLLEDIRKIIRET